MLPPTRLIILQTPIWHSIEPCLVPTGEFDGESFERTPTAYVVFAVCYHFHTGFKVVIGLGIGIDLHL